MEYIIVSCMDKHSCGMSKGTNYSKEFINPVLESPLDYFKFHCYDMVIVFKVITENRDK